jgi:hypothetical protein
MEDSGLDQIIALIKAGRKQEAQGLLLQLLRDNPQQETAWLWLVETMPDVPKQIRTLEECLKYFPNSQAAQRGLIALRQRAQASDPVQGVKAVETPAKNTEISPSQRLTQPGIPSQPAANAAPRTTQAAQSPRNPTQGPMQAQGFKNEPPGAVSSPTIPPAATQAKPKFPIIAVIGGLTLAGICGIVVLLLVLIPLLNKKKDPVQAPPPSQSATEVVRVDDPNEDEINSLKVYDAIRVCFQKYVTQDGEEYVSPTGVRFKNLAPYGIGPSEELSDADRANGVVWKGMVKLEFLVKEKETWETGYFYWGEYLVYQDGRIASNKMGRSQDMLTCDQLTNGEAIGYGFRQVLAEPTSVPPVFTLIPWGVSSKDALNKPGWLEYVVPIAIRSDNAIPSYGPKFNSIGSAKISTAEGETYEAAVAHFRSSENNQEVLSGLDLSEYLLPPGAILKGYSLDSTSYNSPSLFISTFIIPTALQPTSLAIHPQNQVQVAPLALRDAPAENPLTGQFLDSIPEGQPFPYTDPETSVVRMTLGSPHIIIQPLEIREGKRWGEETAPFIVLDVDLTNQDKTQNQAVELDFYVIDSNGILYPNWDTQCSSPNKDGVILHSIGPAIDLHGVSCISLRGIEEAALNNGHFVLAVQREDEGLQWFKLSLPAP